MIHTYPYSLEVFQFFAVPIICLIKLNYMGLFAFTIKESVLALTMSVHICSVIEFNIAIKGNAIKFGKTNRNVYMRIYWRDVVKSNDYGPLRAFSNLSSVTTITIMCFYFFTLILLKIRIPQDELIDIETLRWKVSK